MPNSKARSTVFLVISMTHQFRVQAYTPPAQGPAGGNTFFVALFEGLGSRMMPHVEGYVARLRGTLTLTDRVGPVTHVQVQLPATKGHGTAADFLARGCRFALGLQRLIANYR